MENFVHFIKKFGCLVGMLLMLVGLAWSLYSVGKAHEWFAFVGILVLAAAAAPTFIKMWKFLKD